MYRGKRPASDPLPDGDRQDTRKHTRHCLRPEPDMVTRYLAEPESYPWREFKHDYQKLLRERFDDDRGPFDELAKLAVETDVYIGCSCPTKKNPDVSHCHTVLALKFMEKLYPKLDVRFP
jgi:hypothetical protein